MNFFEKNKKELFPDVTDWIGENDELRFAKDVNARPAKYYYFFHHMSYKITMWAFHILSFSLFLTGTYIMFYWNFWIGAFILLLLTLYKVKKIINFAKDMENFPNKNFYDVFLREYKW